jgi:glycosyltransferase involved in cell wall biosynthesis
VRASDLVLAHSPSTLAELAGLGAVARSSAVIQHGPILPPRPTSSLRHPSADGGPRRILFFGRVQEYKGVEDLLNAFAALPNDVAAHLTVAGQCADPGLSSRLRTLARGAGPRVVLRLEHVPEPEVAELLAAADVVVLPFRRVTTSGSAMLALSHGRPLIVPDLPGLADLPDPAVLRYGGGVAGLTRAMAELARADRDLLTAMSAAAERYASRTTWREIAAQTMAEMLSVLGSIPEADLCGQPVIAP